jgi:hypothetical protein
MVLRAKKTRLRSIDPRRVYRAADLCELLSLPDSFLKSLAAMLKDSQPHPACFIDGDGQLWCLHETITQHLKRLRAVRGVQR